MSDIALNESGTDIDIQNGAGLRLVEGTDAIAQNLLIRLRFVKGEYFLDRRLGVPYLEKLLVKNPNLLVVRSVFRETILETAGVESISRFDLDFDTPTRRLRVDASCVVTTSSEPLDFSTEFLIGD